MMEAKQQLEAGARHLNIRLDKLALEYLIHYLGLLQKWNRAYNLLGTSDTAEIINRHMLDSLSALTFIQVAGIQQLVDAGSGAGFPGMLLAMADNRLQFVLVESNHKKAAFLQQVQIDLELSNVKIQHGRVENWQPPQRVDAVISRAFACLADFVGLAGHLISKQGRLLAMKAKTVKEEELGALPAGWRIDTQLPLQIMHPLTAETTARQLIVLEKT